MPDIIRPATADSTVVVTISAIADVSSGTTAKTPTVSATIDRGDGGGAVAATITAWAWEQDDSTANITGPTTATPSIAIVAGRHTVTVNATVEGIAYPSGPEVYTVGPTALSAIIDAISDQSTLDPIVFDVDITGGVTPYTIGWLVNAAVTNLNDATLESPTYTPPASQGRKAVSCLITDAVGNTCQATPRSFVVGPDALTASLAAIADQLTLAAIQCAATATGGIGTKTHDHTVNGATTGLDDPDADPAVLNPTFTPPAAGEYTWVYTVTDAAGQTARATRTFTVGDTDGYIHSHLATWANETAGGITTTYTADGVVYTANGAAPGDGELTVGETGLLMDSGTNGVAIQWPATSGGARTLLQSDDVIWYVAVDDSINTNGDTLSFNLLNAAGTERAIIVIDFTGGARRMVARRVAASTNNNFYKAEATAVRVVALRRIGAQSFQVKYSTTAYDGTWPLFSAMTEILANVSGRFNIKDNPAGDTGAGTTVNADPIPWDATSLVRLAVTGVDHTIAATGIKWKAGA